MTKNKRYTYLNYSKDGYIGSFYENDKPLTNKEVWDILNEQKKEIEYLETKIKENEWHWNTIDEDRDVWHYKCNQAEERVKELKDENEQLKRKKERYKLLSEIRDENINNRILSLKDFINNCEDKKVKNTLEDLFYSEVKEYDLAKENRKLKRENEQLKKVAKEFVQNRTQHNFWKLRTVLKDSGVE